MCSTSGVSVGQLAVSNPGLGNNLLPAQDTGWNNLSLPWTAPFQGGETNFATLPTELWLPQVQTTDASLGVQTNQFGFTINWASGMSVAVDASPSLVNPTWTPLTTNTLTSGSLYFSDPNWTNYPSRFYRVTWP